MLETRDYNAVLCWTFLAKAESNGQVIGQKSNVETNDKLEPYMSGMISWSKAFHIKVIQVKEFPILFIY